MAQFDFSDLYIRYKGHPIYSPNEVIQDEIILIIIQKVEMILFTSRGDLIGDVDFGADLEKYLHETKVSTEYVKKQIEDQFAIYIPELTDIPYDLEIYFVDNKETFSDMMFIDFKLRDIEVNAFFA